MIKALRTGGLVVLQAVLLWAAIHSVRHMRAQQVRGKLDLESLQEASKEEPGNAEVQADLARLAIDAGRPDEAELRFADARRLSPADASIVTENGLFHEQQRRTDRAEQDLLLATRLSSAFGPRWALANFYFRNGPKQSFRHWIRSAQLVAGDRLTSTFRLCEEHVENASDILAQCIAQDAEVVSQYTSYLLSHQEVEQALSVARHLPGLPITLLLTLCEKAVQSSRMDEALPLWQELSSRGAVAPKAQADALVNGDFRWKPADAGFDWHLTANTSVTFTFHTPELAIALSGSQPEELDLLWQPIALLGGHRYTLEFEFRTQGIQRGDGPGWSVSDKTGNIESKPLSSEDWQREVFTFEGAGPSWLTLRSARHIGFSRIEGSIRLRNLRLRDVL